MSKAQGNNQESKAMLANTYENRTFAADIVEDGPRYALKFRSEPYLRTTLRKMGLGAVSVIITNKKPKRTQAQHNFLWVYYTLIAQETGHTPEEIHEWAKRQFLPKTRAIVMDKEVEIVGSTTNLSVADFSEYVMRIEAETNIQTPPTENYNLADLRPKLI